MEQEALNNTPFLIRAFSEGGPVMWVIALIGVVTMLVIVQRFMKLGQLSADKKDVQDTVFGLVLRGDVRQAIAYCDNLRTPLTEVIRAGLVQAMNRRPDEEVQVAMDAAVMRENHKFEGLTPVLAVTGNIAVLAGLLGTIIGMIGSFRAVAAADPAEKAAKLSEGISHALNCTAFGLTVAIISIVFYGYFQLVISKAENEVIETSMTLLNLVASNRDKLKD